MGQFKPMVKMQTTEPTVELKLKKGGKVEKKMQMGGTPAGAPAMTMSPPPGGMPPPGMAPMPGRGPKRPNMFARRRAMGQMGGAPGAGPVGGGDAMMEAMETAKTAGMGGAPMKKGGKADSMKALKEHASKPASKAHKGLKTGGVVMGQGGYKAGGIIKTTAKKTTKMDTAHVDTDKGPTGGVKLGNAGGYKKGGMAKRKDCYATGGVVMGQGGYKKGGEVKKGRAAGEDDGAPVAMPQGRKPAPKPVAISKLSGTYKKGGPVMTPAQKRLDEKFQKENAPAMKAAKKMSNEKYGPKMQAGGAVKRAAPKVNEQYGEDSHARAFRKFREKQGLGSEFKDLVQRLTPEQAKREQEESDKYMRDGAGAVTETERSITVSPGMKHGGKAKKMAGGGYC